MALDQSTIFGDRDFGFELIDIAEARRLAAENSRIQADMLTDEDERIRRVAERGKESSEQEVAFFEAHDDEAILGGLRYIFERGKELEASGLSELDVASAVRSEIPDFSIIGGILLERQTWGYSLNQKSISASLVPKEQR